MYEIKTSAPRELGKEIEQRIENNELTASFITANFKRRSLTLKDNTLKHTADAEKVLKSLYVILQIGVFFTSNNKIAVFQRPPEEKDKSTKVTTFYSIVKSWSPGTLDPVMFERELSKKVQLQTGPRLSFKPYGTAFTDIIELDREPLPFYLFPLYCVQLSDQSRLASLPHPDPRKHTENLVEWCDIASYQQHSFPKEVYNPHKMKNELITFQGAIDRLVLYSLNNPTEQKPFNSTRGFAMLNRQCQIKYDVENLQIDELQEAASEYAHWYLKLFNFIKKTLKDNTVTFEEIIKVESKIEFVLKFKIDLIKLFQYLRVKFYRLKNL